MIAFTHATAFHRTLRASIVRHQFLLLPIFVIHVVILYCGILLGFILASLLIEAGVNGELAGVLGFAAGFALGYLAMGHFLFLLSDTLTAITNATQLTSEILAALQLIVVSILFFAIAHYCVDIASSGYEISYEGMHDPIAEKIDRAAFHSKSLSERFFSAPDMKTIINCIYFSTVTTATVGYGDISPSSPVARLVTTTQIVFSFGLVIVLLGRLLGVKGG
jgi:voltage-gated potassium channel Kch